MFSHKHYVAVLRWRKGEAEALQKLYDSDRELITPLIEPLPNKGGGFSTIIKDIGKKWGFTPFFLDLNRINPTLRLSDGTHPLILMAKEAKSMRLALIPAVGLNRHVTYKAAVKSVAKILGSGICIRVYRKDLEHRNFPMELLNLCSTLGVEPKDVDLIIDLEVTADSNTPYVKLCREIPKLTKWRTFTVASGAFPENLEKISKNSQRQISRSDYLSWRNQVMAKPRLPRKPSFGDYTIQCPIYVPKEGFQNPSASIRYTASDYWLIMRGEGLYSDNSPGHAQYPAQALLLCEQKEFSGVKFSAGDKYIKQTSLDSKHPGTPKSWISAGINHHLTFVARQISTMP